MKNASEFLLGRNDDASTLIAGQACAYISQLYDIAREVKHLSAAESLQIRQAKSKHCCHITGSPPRLNREILPSRRLRLQHLQGHPMCFAVIAVVDGADGQADKSVAKSRGRGRPVTADKPIRRRASNARARARAVMGVPDGQQLIKTGIVGSACSCGNGAVL